jgi:hypothetical protein
MRKLTEEEKEKRRLAKTKICIKCSIEKPISEYYPINKDGDTRNSCKECCGESNRKWWGNTPEEIRQKRYKHYQKYYTENREEIRRKQREYGKTEEGRHNLWLSQIRCYFKLEESDYLDLLDKQGGGCGICGSKGEGSKKLDFLCVDHDHKCCNKRKTCGDCVRGLLCGLCNLRLGMLEKIGRLDLASKAEKDYLNKYKKRRKENGTRSELE